MIEMKNKRERECLRGEWQQHFCNFGLSSSLWRQQCFVWELECRAVLVNGHIAVFTVALLRQWWDDATCTFQDKKMSKISKDTMTCTEKLSLPMILALSVLTLTHSILLMTIMEHSWHFKLWPNNTALSNALTDCLFGDIAVHICVYLLPLFLCLFSVPIDSFSFALVSNEKLKSEKKKIKHFKTPSVLQKSQKTSTLAFWGQIMQIIKRTKEYFKTTLVISLLCHLSLSLWHSFLVYFIVLCLSLHFPSHLGLWPFFSFWEWTCFLKFWFVSNISPHKDIIAMWSLNMESTARL